MSARPLFILAALITAGFTSATCLQPRALSWSQKGQDSVLKVVLGDGRKLFANHFFTKADIYFHSGYYPSVFDRQENAVDPHSMSGEMGHDDEEHEKHADFLGRPKDWVEKFGRHFMVTTHTHLEGGNEREILPWLKLSAELDPQQIDTYIVAAFWLRTRLNKLDEAEQFLREGLRYNPNSYEILFALGSMYKDNFHDNNRARNVWELALKRWEQVEGPKKNPDKLGCDEITVNLGRLEEEEGNIQKAIEYLERARELSPAPEVLQKQIDELRKKANREPK